MFDVEPTTDDTSFFEEVIIFDLDLDDATADDIEQLRVLLPSFERTSVLVHILAVSFFFLVGLVENPLVIYIYSSRKRDCQSDSTYVISLAVLDIIACGVIAPQFPFLRYYGANINLYLTFFSWIMLCYLYILVAMSLERLCAVLFPMTYRRTLHRHKYFAVTIFTVTFILIYLTNYPLQGVGSNIRGFWNRILIISSTLVSFMTILVTYIVIVRRLYRQGRKIGAAALVSTSRADDNDKQESQANR